MYMKYEMYKINTLNIYFFSSKTDQILLQSDALYNKNTPPPNNISDWLACSK